MELIELPGIEDWLSQFDLPDRYLAEFVIRRLRYVGFEEFEEWIQKSIQDLLAEIEKKAGRKQAVAIFPLPKPSINLFNRHKEEKTSNDSSARIGHALKNLERGLPKHIELSPRLESMRAMRVRHIIFVDDFIGTGDRVIAAWRKEVHRSVKSWCSRGWCKVWLLVFAGHTRGIKRVVHRIRPFSFEGVRANLQIDASFLEETPTIVDLCKKYGARVGRHRGAFGYGDLLSPVIFQHGCPNNASELLWLGSKGSRRGWVPLFRNRHIPSDLYPLFSGDVSLEATAEQLWMSKHYQVALEILERVDDFRKNHQLVLVLALVNKGKNFDVIRNSLVMTDSEFNELIASMRSSGLLADTNDLSGFGRDILRRLEKSKRKKREWDEAQPHFYPATFLGFQRAS